MGIALGVGQDLLEIQARPLDHEAWVQIEMTRILHLKSEDAYKFIGAIKVNPSFLGTWYMVIA